MSVNYSLRVLNVRISYPHLYVARPPAKGAEPKFSGSLIVPKDNPVIAELTPAYNDVVTRTWPQGVPHLQPMPWADGDTDPAILSKVKENEPNIFAGCWRFRCSSVTRPKVVELLNGNLVEILDPGKIYPGCLVHAYISLYSYQGNPNSGLTFGLDGIMYAGEGERLDGRPTTDAMFGGVPGAPAPTAHVPGVGGPAPGAAAGPPVSAAEFTGGAPGVPAGSPVVPPGPPGAG